ncbi:MAG: methyltransferase family protein [Vulcanimicrobiaceae bacterium]
MDSTGDLGRKTIVALVTVLALIGAIIFLPAWTLNYWQAWVFLAVYAICNVFVVAYLWKNDRALLQRRMSAGPAAERSPSQKIIMFLVSIGFIALLVVSALDHRLRWSNVTPVVAVFGDILVALGFYIELLVLRANSFAAATIEVASDQKVISTGPYAVVRHPMYAGGALLLFGIPLALGSYWGLAVLAAMMPALIWRLFDEEAFLAKNLPGYEEYQSKVRWRLLPRFF